MNINGNKPSQTNDLYRSVQQKDSSAKGKTAGKPSMDAEAGPLNLSNKAMKLENMAKAVENLPDVRVERVETLKKAIESGTYEIDSRAIAKRIMEEVL